ncbi:MAG: hypothetical protein GY762_01620 [Proteobacteria bacterium]|nr:hypothetical protein [Pseudomonadota bacterium]
MQIKWTLLLILLFVGTCMITGCPATDDGSDLDDDVDGGGNGDTDGDTDTDSDTDTDIEPSCNDDTDCDDNETVASCPADCWNSNKITTCRVAYNETRDTCLDYTVDTDATEKTPMEIYQYINESCIKLGRDDNCQFRNDEGELSEEDCWVNVSQENSCLEMACNDVSNYHICVIPPVNTDHEQIMSLDFGVTTIRILPYDAWTQAACNTMSGLEIYPPESNWIIKDDDLTCDLY